MDIDRNPLSLQRLPELLLACPGCLRFQLIFGRTLHAARHPSILNRKLVGRPYEYQCKLARQMIDATASAVVGSHTHVTQTVETYRGKPIV